MKKALILNLVLFTLNVTSAQNGFQVIEQNVPYKRFATSFTTDIIGENENFVMYNWQKFIEKHQGVTYLISNAEGDVEFESEHVRFPLLDNKLVTMHSRFTPDSSETGVLLTLWIQMKDGTYYSSKTDKHSAEKIKNWLLKFNEQLMGPTNLDLNTN